MADWKRHGLEPKVDWDRRSDMTWRVHIPAAFVDGKTAIERMSL
jgi:hypothetical protein